MNSRSRSEKDSSFDPDRDALHEALDALLRPQTSPSDWQSPESLPELGLGDAKVLELLAPLVIGGARRLNDEVALAHMDPPTPWVTWATALWNAALNQNLLHPDLSPVAREIENRLMNWLAPLFGMTGGHMTSGSTVANLTALWAARETKAIERVVTSKAAHLSVAKSAHILGLDFLEVDVNRPGQLDYNSLPRDLTKSALVLTAGTTSAGALDDLGLQTNAAWTHVDAAWAGPLRLSDTYRNRLHGIDSADSVSISAHKWLFQPKDSGMILFQEAIAAHEAVSFGGAYLATPNVGVLGSRGANAIPLFAMLLSWGRTGVANRIDAAMATADELASYVQSRSGVRTYAPNVSGVILWRAENGPDACEIVRRLPAGSASLTSIDGEEWVRHVAANPNVSIEALTGAIARALT
jgi:L-2,4-diaminobutyrate decarboxylase